MTPTGHGMCFLLTPGSFSFSKVRSATSLRTDNTFKYETKSFLILKKRWFKFRSKAQFELEETDTLEHTDANIYLSNVFNSISQEFHISQLKELLTREKEVKKF